ncbi:MAG: type II toxin-antitoxin system VapC family toxin [Micrococcales bacterium]|nr:type II toxin-antitoxin system VapC family toxin [Micrococcales bacterium]
MSSGLLDTNILIHWARLDPSQLPAQAAISTVTLAELSAGVHAASDAATRADRLDLLQRAESGFDPIPFDVAAARAYGRITAAVSSIGRSPRSRVAVQMIAAIAASRDLALYTMNPADFSGLDAIVTVVPVTRPAS